jgi:hypothetical protein
MSIEKQGRPPIKKGKSTWKPASLNEFTDKEEGYRYRMSRKDPENLAKKEQEGWENVSKINGSATEHVAPERIGDHKPLTSVREGRDWILQRIPEEQAKERDAYYQSESDRRTAGLTAHIKKEIKDKGGNAPVHGEITISTRQGEQKLS